MQSTSKTDYEGNQGISEALSKVQSETHELRMQTSELHRALPGLNCNTLRLLLAKQQHELRCAERALASRAREVLGNPSEAPDRLEDSEPVWGGCGVGVDDKIMVLVEAHGEAAHDAFAAAGSAKEVHDMQSYRLLKRRADAHDVAVWTLGPMLITSVTACELCSTRFSCPLRASLASPQARARPRDRGEDGPGNVQARGGGPQSAHVRSPGSVRGGPR